MGEYLSIRQYINWEADCPSRASTYPHGCSSQYDSVLLNCVATAPFQAVYYNEPEVFPHLAAREIWSWLLRFTNPHGGASMVLTSNHLENLSRASHSLLHLTD